MVVFLSHVSIFVLVVRRIELSKQNSRLPTSYTQVAENKILPAHGDTHL